MWRNLPTPSRRGLLAVPGAVTFVASVCSGGNARVVSAMGISPGMNQAAVEAAFGSPDQVEPGMFDVSTTNSFDFDGDRAFHFAFSGADVLWSVPVGHDTAIYLSEGCL